MVNKVLVKETFNFIKKNFKMYFSQIIIILLGVGFFIGMKVSVVDLHKIMSCFIEEHCLYDYRISVDYGIEQKDIDILKSKMPNVKYAEGAFSDEVITNINNVNSVVKIHSFNKNNKINTLKVLSGKLPDSKTDCVIDTDLQKCGYNVGDTITIQSEYLKVEILKITGVVQSPNYLTLDRGNSNSLSGKIDYYVYVCDENIDLDVYSEVYLKCNVNFKPFTSQYNNYLKNQYDTVNNVFTDYYKNKYSDIIEKEQKNIDEAKKEYDVKKQEVDLQLSTYENEIKEKEDRIKDAESKILTEEEIENKIKENLDNSQTIQEQFNNVITSDGDNQEDIEKKIKEYTEDIEKEKDKIKSYNEDIQKEKEKISELENGDNEGIIKHDGIKQLEEELKELEAKSSPSKIKINILKKKIASKKEEVAECQNNITTLNNKITQSNKIIAYYSNKIQVLSNSSNSASVENSVDLAQLNTYDKLYDYYSGQKKEAEKKIKVYKDELKEAKELYNEMKESAYRELNDIETKLADAQDKVNSFSNPQNYIFNRNDNPSYSQFIDDTTTIINLGKLVPILFFLIFFILL